MKRVMVLLLGLLLASGCVLTDNYSYNLKQATARSTGDLAITVLMDEGTKKADAIAFCNAIVKFLEDGALTKSLLRESVNKLLTSKFKSPQYGVYVDGLFLLIPSEVDTNQKIPAKYRKLMVSFLKDGAIHGANLYDPAHPPKKED